MLLRVPLGGTTDGADCTEAPAGMYGATAGGLGVAKADDSGALCTGATGVATGACV